MIQMLSWIKRFRWQKKSDAPSHKLDDAIESFAQQTNAIDPDTNRQWQRIQTTLAREQSHPYVQRMIFPKIFPISVFSYAVAVVILIAVGTILFRSSTSRTYETAKGGQSTMNLPDGSEVTLNHTSELTVYRSPFSQVRRVSLKGEAFFRVKKDGTPFMITTDIGTVQVLGTQFNVRVRDGRMEVAVVSGSVKINAVKNGTDSSVILSGGQIAVCVKNNFPGMPAALPFVDYPGWIHGKFLFYRSTVLSACKEIESQFNVVVKIDKPQLQDETITGIVDGQNVESSLSILARLTGNTYRHEDSSYVLY
jgi:transmembrane sensor